MKTGEHVRRAFLAAFFSLAMLFSACSSSFSTQSGANSHKDNPDSPETPSTPVAGSGVKFNFTDGQIQCSVTQQDPNTLTCSAVMPSGGGTSGTFTLTQTLQNNAQVIDDWGDVDAAWQQLTVTLSTGTVQLPITVGTQTSFTVGYDISSVNSDPTVQYSALLHVVQGSLVRDVTAAGDLEATTVSTTP